MRTLITIATIITLATASYAAWPVHLESGSSCGTASDIEGSLNDADTAHGWGDHSAAGYAGTGSVADVVTDVAAVSGRVDTVEGWGDHEAEGYALVTTVNSNNAVQDATMNSYTSRIDHALQDNTDNNMNQYSITNASKVNTRSGGAEANLGQNGVHGLWVQDYNTGAYFQNTPYNLMAVLAEDGNIFGSPRAGYFDYAGVRYVILADGSYAIDATGPCRFNAPADLATLGNQPSGITDLAIATTKFVHDTIASASVPRGNLTMTGVDWSATAAGGFEPVTNWTLTASHDVTLSATGMVIDVAGWYDIDASASFSVANNNTDPICQLHTNGVAVPYIGWQRTITSSAKGVVSGAGHIYIASGTLINMYIDTASTDTTYTFLNHSLRINKIGN